MNKFVKIIVCTGDKCEVTYDHINCYENFYINGFFDFDKVKKMLLSWYKFDYPKLTLEDINIQLLDDYDQEYYINRQLEIQKLIQSKFETVKSLQDEIQNLIEILNNINGQILNV